MMSWGNRLRLSFLTFVLHLQGPPVPPVNAPTLSTAVPGAVPLCDKENEAPPAVAMIAQPGSPPMSDVRDSPLSSPARSDDLEVLQGLDTDGPLASEGSRPALAAALLPTTQKKGGPQGKTAKIRGAQAAAALKPVRANPFKSPQRASKDKKA
jgi:hypothetical protein